MRRIIFIVLAGFIATAVYCGAADSLVVARVDGTEITIREFELSLAPCRAMVLSGSSVSLHDVVQRAMNRAIEIKIQQMMALEHGLLQDVSYAHFLSQLRQENIARMTAKQNGKVVFGPLEFSEQAFFDYYLSNILLKLKQTAIARQTDVSDSVLRTQYASIAERDFNVSTGVLPFEEASDIMRARLVDEAFAERMRDRKAHAKIEVDEVVMNRIQKEYEGGIRQ